MAIFIEFDNFWSIGVQGGGGVREGGGARSQLSLIPYFFESMYSHVYGIKWSNGHHGVSLSKLTIFFRIKFYLIFIKIFIKNLTLL